MSTHTDQLDAMIIEGEARIEEFEAQLRESSLEIDPTRTMHILVLLHRGLQELYVERLATLTEDYRMRARREEMTSAWLH